LIGALLAASWLLSACVPTPTARRPVAQGLKPSAKPGAGALVTPKPGASRKPVLPAGPTVRLTGKVELDAHYIIANNAGSLIANNGGSAIVLKGGTLISDNGLGLISDNGLGLISDNGLGLISNNGAGYRTLSTDVAVGTVLPVKGMAVIPVSMRSGEIVGKPVFTDAQGGYVLEVPESLKGNLRLVARVPVTKQDDPIAQDSRMQYNLVVGARAATKASTLDEDTALTTKYLRACFASRIREAMVTDDVAASTEALLRALEAPELLLNALKGAIGDLNAAGKAINVKALSAAEVDRIAQRATDVLLSHLDLDTLEVDPATLNREFLEGSLKELALPGMTEVLKQVRTGAKGKMTADARHFDTHPLILKAARPYTIRRPSDLCDFLVEDFLLGTVDRFPEVEELFMSIDVPHTQATRLNTLSIGILAAVGQTLLTNTEAKTQMVDAIRSAKAP
jgi:hypothetical protein